VNPSLYLKCPKCKVKRNLLLSPFCPICPEKGRLHNDRAQEQRKQFLGGQSEQERGGGPKPRKKICPRCNFVGFVKRNPFGNSSNCMQCGKRR